jgi:CRISPR-associated protein Csx17
MLSQYFELRSGFMALKLPKSSVMIGEYTYRLMGVSDRPMGYYLAALGLTRITERHIDDKAQFYWQGTDFYINTKVPQSELVKQLLASYEAMVAFNPWHKPSGIKIDKETGELSYVGSIAQIANSDSWRTKKIKELLPEFWRLIDEFKVQGATFSYPEKVEKLAFIEQCLSRITNPHWREWADAAVILMEVTNKQGNVSIKAKYPALLGSGGNVGAVDIAENYYSAVGILFDPQTGEPAANAAACFTKAIFGTESSEVTESKEVKALHLFPSQDYKLDFALSKNNDYAPSGGSSASTVNPALVLLASEGLSTFSGHASGGGGDTDTGKPLFGRDLAKYSLAVATSGASTDLVSLDERKSFTEEYFLPLWSKPRTYTVLKRNLFVSPFADGTLFTLTRQIADGTDFIQVLQEWAIDNKIAGKFARYSMLPRKGQSNFAVMLETVDVGAESQRLDLAADLEDYRRNLRGFAKSDDCPALVQGSIYHFDRIYSQFIQGKSSHSDLLMALGKLAPVRWPKSLEYDWISPLLTESNCPEFRLALSIASCGIKYYLHGENKVFAVGNPIASLIRLQQRWGFEAEKGKPFYATPQRIFARFADISAFINNPNFDDRLFECWLWALSLIDFKGYIEQIPTEDSPLAVLKLSPAYRLGLVHIKTFDRKNSPVAAIAYSGDPKSIVSHLMGVDIYLRAGKSPPALTADVRTAAALAFPVSEDQKLSVLGKFFIKKSNLVTSSADVTATENVA